MRLATGRCYQPKVLEERRLWGFMAQLYGLRSERNWGIGDFHRPAPADRDRGRPRRALVGVNPLHATQGSPYSPSSRHALNFSTSMSKRCPAMSRRRSCTGGLQALRDSDLVDYEAVRRVKLAFSKGVFKE